ncbi:hypothetical protein GCM10027056_29880 [Glaciibacter psychrotolerans]
MRTPTNACGAQNLPGANRYAEVLITEMISRATQMAGQEKLPAIVER